MPAAMQQGIRNPDAFGAGVGRALSRAGDTFERVGYQQDRRAQEIQRETNALRVMELDNQAQREVMDFLYAPETGLYNKKGGNALNVKAEAQKKMEDVRQRYLQMGDNPDVKTMMTERLTRLENSTLDQTTRYAFSQYGDWKRTTLDSRLQMNAENAALNWNDENIYQERLASNRALMLDKAKQEGWSDETLQAQLRTMESGLVQNRVAQAIATGEPRNVIMAQNYYMKQRAAGLLNFESSMKMEQLLKAAVPKALAQSALKTGRSAYTDADSSITFVVDALEGGDQIAQEPDGAIAKFGINSKANPDVDVKNLTREEALKIYKAKYWDANGIESLPENMRMIALDTVVNHGGGEFGQKVLKEIANGATKDEVLNMRLAEYQRLATSDPAKYAKYYEGWTQRLLKLDATTGAGYDTKTAYAEAEKLEAQFKGAGAEFIDMWQTQNKAKETVKAERKKEITDQVQQQMTQSGGDYTKLPAALRSEAAGLGIDVTAFKVMTDPVRNKQAVNAIESLNTNQFLQIDFNDPALAQVITYDQKQEYLKKQQDLQKPENKYMADTIDDTVDYYFRAQGAGVAYDPSNKAVAPKVAAMKNYVTFKAQELKGEGKRVTREDVMKFASDYIGMSKNATITNVAQIPQELREKIEYDLVNAGMEVSEAAVMAVYLDQQEQQRGQEPSFMSRMASLFQ